MKILKKIISLTMSAVLLFTTNSALQAAKIDTAQMQEIKELRSDLIKEVKREKLYPNLPKLEEMIATHDRAVKNAEAEVDEMLAELKAKFSFTKEQEEEAKSLTEYFQESLKNTKLSMWSIFNSYQSKLISEETKKIIKQVNQEVEKEANTKRYKKVIKNKDERKRVAANTTLYTSLFYHDGHLFGRGLEFFLEGVIITASFIILYQLAHFVDKKGLSLLTELLCLGDLVVGFMWLAWMGGLLIRFLGGAYTPSISPAFDEKKVFGRFTEKPFEYLADFDKKNKEFEYANVYGKSQRCAQALNDAVDIEYYVSANPNNFENAKDKLYVGTIDWYEMEPEARAEYLHNFAERLRAEAKAQV